MLLVTLELILHNEFKSEAVYFIQEKKGKANFASDGPQLGRGETTALECAFLKLEQRLFGFRHNLPLWLLLTGHLLGKPL